MNSSLIVHGVSEEGMRGFCCGWDLGCCLVVLFILCSRRSCPGRPPVVAARGVFLHGPGKLLWAWGAPLEPNSSPVSSPSGQPSCLPPVPVTVASALTWILLAWVHLLHPRSLFGVPCLTQEVLAGPGTVSPFMSHPFQAMYYCPCLLDQRNAGPNTNTMMQPSVVTHRFGAKLFCLVTLSAVPLGLGISQNCLCFQ